MFTFYIFAPPSTICITEAILKVLFFSRSSVCQDDLDKMEVYNYFNFRTIYDINHDLTFAYDMSVRGEYKSNYSTWRFGRFWFRLMVKLCARARFMAMRATRYGPAALTRIQLNLFRRSFEADSCQLSYFTKHPREGVFRI